MTTFPNPLVVHLLVLSRDLSQRRAEAPGRQVAMRRAISAAYYAVFHALCSVCSSGSAGRLRAAPRDQIYRALDHGTARRRLAERDAFGIHPSITAIASGFKLLQDQRHLADYAPPSHRFGPSETTSLVRQAEELVTLIAALDAEARTRLAIHLLIPTRRPS